MKTRIALASAAGLLASALLGCATGAHLETQTATPVTPATVTFNGVLHGGQQPISGANIQVFAVGVNGLQSSSYLLNTNTVVTNQNGNFSLTNDWDCTSNTGVYGANPLIYIVATGGNPGLGGSVDNPAIAAMAALGPCSSFTPSSFVSINERTTVAAIYALAPFMADYAHIGAPAANAAGLANAFQAASLIADASTGAVPGPALPANGTAPVAEINTLAGILAVCINSTGADASCSTLFAAASSANAITPPTDTMGAALYIAKHPGSNVVTLFNIMSATPPYGPVLMSAPNDWTMAINFTGGGISAPLGIAIDALGNAWVANAGGNSVTELSSTGTLLTGNSGYTGSNNLFGAQGIAVDRSGNVWVADTLLSSVVELTMSGGAIQSNASYTGGGISGPAGIAIDSQNTVWVSNFAGGSVTQLTGAGVPIGSSPLSANATLVNPLGLSIDSAGNVWVTDNSASVVAEFANNQTLLSGAGFADGGILAPEGIALDANRQASVSDNGTNAISLFVASGSASTNSPVTGGGLNLPAAVAIDGNGTAWIANSQTAGSISQLTRGATAPSSLATGFGSLNQPSSIAIDGSGSIWTANAGDNSVSRFIGLASPAVTPLALNVGP